MPELEYTIEKGSLNDLELPPIVYKYREAGNKKHRTILTEQIVYFASPDSFEDKFDCKIPVRYDLLTDDDIYNKYYTELKNDNPGWDDLYLRQMTNRWYNRGLMKDREHLTRIERDYAVQLNERLGVLSLTADSMNHSMWTKYSANLNGFCVGFNTRLMFPHLGGGGAVTYCDELPIIHPFDPYHLRHVKLTFHKLREWEFEREYRTHKFWPSKATDDDRKVKIPGSVFTELIIGENVLAATREELVSEGRKVNPNIAIFIAKLYEDEIVNEIL